jgi:hypothetical protein
MKRSRLSRGTGLVRKTRLQLPEWVTDEISEVLADLDAIKMESTSKEVDDLAKGGEERLERVQEFLLRESGWYEKKK